VHNGVGRIIRRQLLGAGRGSSAALPAPAPAPTGCPGAGYLTVVSLVLVSLVGAVRALGGRGRSPGLLPVAGRPWPAAAIGAVAGDRPGTLAALPRRTLAGTAIAGPVG